MLVGELISLLSKENEYADILISCPYFIGRLEDIAGGGDEVILTSDKSL